MTAQEAANTSTNEETLDTDFDEGFDDSSLEDAFDDDASFEDETDESEETEEDDSANESDEETEEESEEDESEDEEAEGERKDPEAERKRRNDEMAKKRIAAREAKEQAKRQQQEKFLEDAKNTRDLAVRQLQVDAYNTRVLTNENMLQTGIDKAMAHIDLFQSKSPEVKEALGDALDDFERMHIRRNQYGDPVDVSADVFQFLQKRADSIRKLTGIREKNQVRDKAKLKARTMTPPSRAPKKKATDPGLDAFDEEANRW